ncbi:MAG: SAM-dependent methyltransferase [Deltaproteobacteria bacterium]|nr:SAM-dependent methyltransferase [Deltaproteobacteria bacterium]
MPLDTARARQYLKDFNFKALFIEELGWDHHPSVLDVLVDGHTYALTSISQKRGMVVYIHALKGDGVSPDYPTRRKIDRQVSKSVHEHLIIYADKDKKYQTWQWVKREAGKPTQCREHTYYCNQPGDALVQKLNAIAFSLAEEEGLTIVDVTSRVRAGFDVDRVTKRFYDRFKSEHDAFLKFLQGIPDEEMQRWYASVMLNRLMFIYFIQKKGFLNKNIHYLRDKLGESKRHGKDRFYKDFLCPLFFEGFAKKESERKPAINQLLGKVPFLNGGIFQPHQLEELYGRSIQISDTAFEKLFNFFDQYQWHLDERPLCADNEINPDVLGYIFEKYVNQKQMGAYYTKEDITEYISKNTIIPYLFDEAKRKCKIAFEDDQSIWRLLQADPDRYIFDAVKKGVNLSLPEKIGIGLDDVSKRTEWNKPAPEEYALPTEIWREVVTRRKRYKEVRAKISNGEIGDINDLITYNLNIRQFAQDVIENSEGPELLRAFWHAIEEVTILDPTCGSGAFLFAALNILEPLYEACLERMEVFLGELERSGEKHRSDKFSDFRKILDRIEQHPNHRYFILKSIIVNNLYGVDIMEEAIEICKLRLFLKLVAQIERVEDIEPLPDIDFNIRAGNTLVGYATYYDVKKAVLGDTQGKFDLGKDMERIDQKAQDVDRLFKLFREQQTELGGEVSPADKQELRNRLKTLENELNFYLAGEYEVDIPARHSHESGNPESLDSFLRRNDKYQKWLASHKPFHWFIEFYGILKKGGFDVIIGNPPYVEYSKVKDDYTIRDYKTGSCGNLYVYVIERLIDLLSNRGIWGMIAPISLPSTPRMSIARSLIIEKDNLTWCSNFADRPGTLFNGVHQKLSIVISRKDSDKKHGLFTTSYRHWYSKTDKNERDSLMETLTYVPAIASSLCWIKAGEVYDDSVYKKMCLQHKSVVQSFHGASKFSLNMRMMYWGKCFTTSQRSKEYKHFAAPSNLDKKVLVALFNSSLYFWFWELVSDCWHITSKELDSFFLNLEGMDPKLKEEIANLTDRLMGDLENKKGYVGTKQTDYEYYHKLSKPIIDKIDSALARQYDLTSEEIDFVINYNTKYRIGMEKDNEEENS